MLIRNIFALIVLCGTLSLSSLVLADDPEDSDVYENKAEAIQLFRKGVTCFDNKDFQGALSAFETAYTMNPSWKLFYNIAHCQAALKQYGMAVSSFERYLVEGGDSVPDTRRDEVLTELERMRKMIGDIEIVAPSGLDVVVDGIHRGVTPLPGAVSVSAGLVHKIELKDGTEVLFTTEKTVRGETVAEVVYEPRSTVTNSGSETGEGDGVANGNTQGDRQIEPVVKPVQKAAKPLSPVPFVVATSATVLLGGTTIAMAVLVGRGKDDVASSSDADRLNLMRKIGIGTLFGTAGAGVTALILAAFTDFKGERKSPVTFYGAPSEGGVLLSGSF